MNKRGTPREIRTPDLLLRRQLLYPAELLAHMHQPAQLDGAGDGNRTHVSSLEGWCSTIELHPRNAQNRNRTSDTRIFSPLLYQLSYLGFFNVLAYFTKLYISCQEKF